MIRSLSYTSIALLIVSMAPGASVRAQSGADVARSYRESHEVEILSDFAELLSYPRGRLIPSRTRQAAAPTAPPRRA